MNEDQLNASASNNTEDPTPAGSPVDPGQLFPAPQISKPSLFVDKKGKPMDYLNPSLQAGVNMLYNDTPPAKSFEEFMQNNDAILRRDPLYNTGLRTPGVYLEKDVRRYDDQEFGYIPGIDNDDFYGKRESGFATFGKGLTKIVPYTGIKLLEGVGFASGLVSPWNWFGEEGVVSNAAENTLYKWASEMDDYTKNEWLPTFQEAADREKGFWNRLVTDGDFWAEDLVDGAAFALSAFIPGMALTKLGLGARAAAGLSRLGVGTAAVEGAVEGAGSIANYFTNAQKFGKHLDAFNTWAIATASESMFEATEVRNNVREALRAEGKYSEDEIRKIAGEAARNSFLMNAALLGATNVFQYRTMAGLFGVGGKNVGKGMITSGASLADKALLEPAESAFKKYFGGLGGSIAREGYIEENLQLAIERINKEYGIEGKTKSFFSVAEDVLGQYLDQTVKATKGEDAEAATSIGLGGILGAGMSMGIDRMNEAGKRKNAEAVLAGFTNAQNSWLKFGDIYKTEQVEDGVDENGKTKYKTKTLLDPNGQPVVDDDKVAAVLAGVQTSTSMLSDADKARNKDEAEFLRTKAFADFTLAHVNAGIEDSLMEKLDKLNTASAEELAKLGFVRDNNFDANVAKYKGIAAGIIKQSEIIDNSILSDGSKEDNYRISVLKSIGADQVISKTLASKLQAEVTETKNSLITDDITSLSDGIVDQLNEVQLRIDLQKQLIEEVKKQKGPQYIIDLYEKQIKDLEKSYTQLEKDNELTVKNLKKDEGGFYNYEKEERNNLALNFAINRSLVAKAAILNNIKNLGNQWAFFADNINGKKNFKEYYDKMVSAVREQQAKQAEKERADQAAQTPKTEGQPPADTAQSQAPGAATGSVQQKPAVEEEEEDLEDIDVNDFDPELKAKLEDAYAVYLETADGDISFEDYVTTTAGAQAIIKQFNKGTGKKKAKPAAKKEEPKTSTGSQPQPEQPAGPALTEDEQKASNEIDKLKLGNTSKLDLFKIKDMLKGLLDRIAGNQGLVDKLYSKVQEIKDDYIKTVLLKLFLNSDTASGTSTYVPIAKLLTDRGFNHNTPEHKDGMINFNVDEAETGFVIRNADRLREKVSSGGSSAVDLSDRVVVKATRKGVFISQDRASSLSIPNRTMITFETKSEVKDLLAGTRSVIAVASRSTGFGTQILFKGDEKVGEPYVAGVENYAIVHPDNTTEPVTFSEEQREFVKKNMLFEGRPMTDQDYNFLQGVYEKVQKFNQEVEAILGNQESTDITPIFNKYFTLSARPAKRTAVKGQDLQEVIKNNPDSLFESDVQQEDGSVVKKKLALVATKFGNLWKLKFNLAPGETLVTVDQKTGEALPVVDIEEYLEKVQGIKPYFTDEFGAVAAWVAKSPEKDLGYTPYAIKLKFGTEPDRNFNEFALAFQEMKKAILDGLADNKFVFRGKEYNAVSDLTKEFNVSYFGFDRVQDWVVNFSFNSKSKKFALELRPADREKRNQLTAEQKKALNLYFSDKPIASITENSSQEEINKAYRDWISGLYESNKLLSNAVSASTDPVLKAMGATLKNVVLFEFTGTDTAENSVLRLKDRRQQENPFPYAVFNTNSLTHSLKLALNEVAKPSSQTKPKPNLKSSAKGVVKLGELSDEGTLTSKPDTATKADKPVINVYWGSPETSSNTRVLSNLAPRKFAYQGREYGSVEHAYQSNKSGTFDQVTYDKYVKAGGYGTKIRGKAVTQGFDNLQLMKDLVVESFKQNPDQAALLLNYSDFTHTTNEVIDKAFLDGLRLAQKNAQPAAPEGKPSSKTKPAVTKLGELSDEGTLAAKPATDPKADIERRRKKELEGEKYFVKTNAEGLKSAKEFVDRVNAKYDAELAALDNKSAGPAKDITKLGELSDEGTLAPAQKKSEGVPSRKRIIREADDTSPFMLKEEAAYKKYTAESYQEELKWLQENLPADIKLRDLGTIIDNLAAGKQILGYYKDRALYVSQSLSAVGTVYHEAFHALYRDILTPDQRSFYKGKALAKLGKPSRTEIDTFRNERNYTDKTDEQIMDLMAEEYLAEGFRKYKLDKKEPADSWFKLFVKLIDRIINFFKRNSNAIDELYERFDNGMFAASAVRTPSSISEEGVFALAYGRPRLKEVIQDGEAGFEVEKSIPLKSTVQNELVSKLVYQVSQYTTGTFDDKFSQAVEEVKADYNINTLLKDKDPETAQAIRNYFEQDFNEALFVLGSQVPYSLDEAIAQDEDANSYVTDEGANRQSIAIVKKEVKNKIDALGITSNFSSEDYSLPEDEEQQEEKSKGNEFDLVHINPLDGMSKEFRALFNIIPYEKEYPSLGGIKIKKMANGSMLFNAMMKLSADRPVDQILPALAKSVDNAVEDNDEDAVVLDAFANFIADKFGISRKEMSSPGAAPTRNIHLYKQFIDTFFVTELKSTQVKLTVKGDSVKTEVFDASINQDQKKQKDAIAFFYERAFRKLKTQEQKDQFNSDFKKLQNYLGKSLPEFLNQKGINNRQTLNQVVDKLKDLFDNVNIVLPKRLFRQSLLAIYKYENEQEFSANSVQNIRDIETDQALMNEGAYLQKDFFSALSQIDSDNYGFIFADTRAENVSVGKDKRAVDQINKILKSASKYMIKYDIKSAIPVYQNAEMKNVYRYMRYTPPVLLAQMIREKGITSLTDMYPVLKDYMADNPLFDGSLKNQLFLSNFFISSFGGFREVVDGVSDNGVTFGQIDPKAFMLSGIVNFMNRSTLTQRMKNKNGKYEAVTITTFQRSRTQEEATTTNFLVNAMYKKYTSGESANKAYIQDMQSMLRQEYNRIQREWAQREDNSVVRYSGYNENIHPVTGERITGDGYVVNGKTIKLRAYQFKAFEHFFQEKNIDPGVADTRQAIQERLIQKAKEGVPFEEALKDDLIKNNDLQSHFKMYAESTFKVYQANLEKYGLITVTKKKQDNGTETEVFTSQFIPGLIKEDFKDAKPLDKAGYTGLREMLFDRHLNIEMNKRMANQIFDGDIATGIKSAIEYFKRNKSGVISGNSGKMGYVRTAVTQELRGHFFTKVNPLTGKVDVDLEELIQDQEGENTQSTPIADGQSYHTLNHRIRLMDSWGRLDPEVKKLLRQYKFRNLYRDEIIKLANKKVVLNTIKTATGAILEYYKLSEHLISRVDVSYLDLPQGMTKDEAYSILDNLYTQIESLEDAIIEDPYRDNAADLESQIEELYQKVHTYWKPLRGREELHYMLNSMELSGIDQVFDPNASKKTTMVPVKLSANSVTNLKPSKSNTSSLFKFLQVETSGIHSTVTLPSQARQLLTTYINKLKDERVLNGQTLQEIADEYTDVLGQISQSSLDTFNKMATDGKGNLDISKIYQTMYDGLKKQGADSNTLKYFELKDGKPVHSPNIPAIKKQFIYYYFALFNDSIFSRKVSGRADILVSSYGYKVLYDTQDNNRIVTMTEQKANPNLYTDTNRYQTRNLGITKEVINGVTVYNVEVVIPEPLARNESERQLYLEKLNKFFSTRIPTEDRRSMIVAKAVDYMDAAYQNSIVVPQLVHILAGSDLDVDKLYSHTFAHYLDASGTAHVYGDYSKYATKSQGQFAEYIQYMGNHSFVKELIDKEVEKLEVTPVFSKDFYKISEQLGLSNLEVSAEDLEDQKINMLLDLDILQKDKTSLQEEHDMLFNNWITAKTEKNRNAWIEKRAEYLEAKEKLAAAEADLISVNDELERIEKTYRLAATVNILKAQGFPVTQGGFTDYLKSNPTPVIPVLDNISLQQKIDILSNEKVFKDFYINERSTVEPFEEVAKMLGVSVDSVVRQNSIYSEMGDVVANDLNSTGKDGIGITASFNKFLSFAEKNSLTTSDYIINVIDESGKQQKHNNFLNTKAVRSVGQTLGMFADAAKNPIPSVLNLTPDTASIANLIVSMTGNLQLALTLNKVPMVEGIIEEHKNNQSAAQLGNRRKSSLKSLFRSQVKDSLAAIPKERYGEIFEVDKKNQITQKEKPVYFKLVAPNPAEKGLGSLGVELYYEDGIRVKDDVGLYHVARLYQKALVVNTEAIKVGKILNLIKSQNPDFNELDQILQYVDEFLNTVNPVFGKSIGEIFKKNKEYQPLIKAARTVSDYSKQILIERSSLVKSINKFVKAGFDNMSINPKAEENFKEQVIKFVLINKMKSEMTREIEELKSKKDERSLRRLDLLQESIKFFTADFWLNNNTLQEELDYLYDNNAGNAFVELLRINSRQGIDIMESMTRMKLDIDLTENIINGFETLQKSRDPRTAKIAGKMFYYLLGKDGLGYGSFTFIKYLNPDMKMFGEASDALNQFMNLLKDQESFIDSIKDKIQQVKNSGLDSAKKEDQIRKLNEQIIDNYNKLFDKFFNNTSRPGQIDWISGIVSKIYAYAGNQKYVREIYGTDIKSKDNKDILAKIISSGVYSHINEKNANLKGSYFNYLALAKDKFTIDYSKVTEEEFQDQLRQLFKYDTFLLDADTNLLKTSFSPLIKDGDGNLYRLNTVDGNRVADMVTLGMSVGSTYTDAFTGTKAEYTKVDVEGSENLLSFGFTPKDAKEIYDATQEKEEEDDDIAFYMNGSAKVMNSDNKPGSTVSRQVLQDEEDMDDQLAQYSEEDELGEEDINEDFYKKFKSSRKPASAKPAEVNLEDPQGPVQVDNVLDEDDLTDEMLSKFKGAKKPGNVKAAQPAAPQGVKINYTPKGKTRQTYTVIGSKIYNSKNEEVFAEDSVDRYKIFANLAVQSGRAVIVEYKGTQYVVNNKQQIISTVTGKIMNWSDDNGNRKAILASAAEKFKSVNKDVDWTKDDNTSEDPFKC